MAAYDVHATDESSDNMRPALLTDRTVQSDQFAVGSRVRHFQHGEGTVLRQMDDMFYVDFGHRKMWVFTDRLMQI